MNSQFKFNDTHVNFEKKMNIFKNLRFSVPNIKEICFEVNPYAYIGSFELFLCNYLFNIKEELIKPIYFFISNEINSKGYFIADSKGLYMHISDKNIKKEVDDYSNCLTYIDELFLTTLHEICHMKQYLLCMQENCITDKNIDEFNGSYFNPARNKNFLSYMNNTYKEEDFIIYADDEFEAVSFSYEKLPIIKGMYKWYFSYPTFCILERKNND